MVTEVKEIPLDFYRARALTPPTRELWPSSAEEVRELFSSPLDASHGPMRILGEAQHVRLASAGTDPWQAVRMGQCDAILSLDERSGLVRAEAGVTWGALREWVEERGFTLDRYALQPSRATLGGLLAGHRLGPKQFYSGDVRDGCVAINALSPIQATSEELASYDYLAAPRKASGPDMRYLHIGAEGRFGAILDVTMVVWPALSGRIYRLAAPMHGVAIRAWKATLASGVRISWSRWSREDGHLELGVHGPSTLLSRLDAMFSKMWSEGVIVGNYEEEKRRRVELEDHHIRRRTAPDAPRTLEVLWRLDQLKARIGEASAWASAITLTDWTPHTVTGHVTASEATSLHDVIERVRENALGASPVIEDRCPVDDDWTVSLRETLDPQHLLAANT